MKQMFTSKLGSIASYLSSFVPRNNQQDKLLRQIQQACYPKQNVSQLHACISQLMKQQSSLQIKTKAISQYPPKLIVTLYGAIQVPFGSNSYSIMVCIQIPEHYPNQSPMISIFNIDMQKFSVHPDYERGRISNNQYILPLQGIKQWNKDHSLMMLINEAKRSMGSRFPFRKKNISSIIFQKTTSNIKNTIYFKNSLLFLDEATNLVNRIPAFRQFQKVQKLHSINQIVLNHIEMLKLQNQQVNNSILQQQKQQRQNNLLNMIEIDTRSKALLDLITEQYAYASDMQFLESKLFNQQINLQQFLKYARRIEQQRFMAKTYINLLINTTPYDPSI